MTRTYLSLAAIVGLFGVVGHFDYQDAVRADAEQHEATRLAMASRSACVAGTLVQTGDGAACLYENSDGSRILHYLTPTLGIVPE